MLACQVKLSGDACAAAQLSKLCSSEGIIAVAGLSKAASQKCNPIIGHAICRHSE